MKKIIILGMILISLFNFVSAEEQKVYSLNLKYDNGVVTKERLVLSRGVYFSPVYQPEDKYKLKIISFTNEELCSLGFDFPLFVFGTTTQLEMAKKDFILPYFSNGKSIVVYDGLNTKILEVDISQYATERITEPTTPETIPQSQTEEPEEGYDFDEERYFESLMEKIQRKLFKKEEKITEGLKSSDISCLDGCRYNDNCYNIGYRLGVTYCNENKEWTAQKQNEGVCGSDYECLGNKCIDGKCFGKSMSEFQLCWKQKNFLNKLGCFWLI